MDDVRSHPSVELVRELASLAGLKVDAKRAERLRLELAAALDAVAALDAAIEPDAPGTAGVGDFDAGWGAPQGRGRQ